MKKERETQKIRASSVYPLVASMVVALLTVFLAWVAGQNVRLGLGVKTGDCAALWAVSFAAARLGMAGAAYWNRRLLLWIGAGGLLCCVGLCVWIFHRSNFELTENSYRALNAAQVPADLIAELKSAEGAVADTEQEFVSDLSGRFGGERVSARRLKVGCDERSGSGVCQASKALALRKSSIN
jgi:hypothetical protein